MSGKNGLSPGWVGPTFGCFIGLLGLGVAMSAPPPPAPALLPDLPNAVEAPPESSQLRLPDVHPIPETKPGTETRQLPSAPAEKSELRLPSLPTGNPGKSPRASGVNKATETPPLAVKQDPPKPKPANEIRLPKEAGEKAVVATAFETPVAPPVIAAKPVRMTDQPTILVTQTGPDRIFAAKEFELAFHLQNAGSVGVTRLAVTTELDEILNVVRTDPQAVIEKNRITWNLGDFPTKKEQTVRLTVAAKSGAIGRPIRNVTDVSYSTRLTHSAELQAPKLALTVLGPKTARVGDPVTLELKLKNEGNAPAKKILLSVPLPEEFKHEFGQSLENEFGSLEAGESATTSLTLQPVKAGAAKAVVNATADGVTSAHGETVINVQSVALKLLGKGPKARMIDRTVQYAFEVTNQGNAEAKDAVLSANLPVGVRFSSADTGGKHDPSKQAVEWSLGNLAPGQSKTVILTGATVGLGEQVCQAVVRAPGSIPVTAQVRTNVEGLPALQVEVIDLEDPVEVGANATYEIRVVNQGSLPAKNVQVLVTGSTHLQILRGEGPSVGKGDDSKLTFASTPTLAPKADLVYRVHAKAKSTGPASLKVAVTLDQAAAPVVEEESTTFFQDN